VVAAAEVVEVEAGQWIDQIVKLSMVVARVVV